MDPKMIIEMVGYLGSILVVVSMLMTSVLKLRVINTIGSVIFAVYALIIQSYPTAAMNFALVLINLYNMRKLMKKSEAHYTLVKCGAADAFTGYFLHHYDQDIHRYFSEFDGLKEGQAAYLILCGEVPAGLMLGKERSGDELEFTLDYTTPAYRDCSVGTFLYNTFRGQGYKKLIYTGAAGNHESYLDKMGFKAENGEYVKQL